MEVRNSAPSCTREVPIIVENCVRFFRKDNNMLEDGVFRESGNVQEVESLKEQFDRGDRPDFEK